MTTLIVLLMLVQSIAVGAAERAQDYAYGIPIHADVQAALQEIEIPAAVYRGVTRSDLGDIQVFNGQGDVVPARAPTARSGGRGKCRECQSAGLSVLLAGRFPER